MQASIRYKILLVVIGCLLITSVIIAIFVLTIVRGNLIQDRSELAITLLENQRIAAEFLLQKVEADTRLIANIPTVHAFLAAPTSENRAVVEQAYTIFMRDSSYSQLRIISPDGMELIRVNQDDGVIEIVDEADLQDKSARDYFTQAINLPNDEIYISELDLNREDGVIQEPYTPTIRYATPIYIDGILSGVAVINFSPALIFDIITPDTDNINFYMVNSLDDIMYTTSPVNDTEMILYATDLGHDTRIEAIFPNLNIDDQSNVLSDNESDNLIASTHITLTSADSIQRNWLLISEQPLATLLEPITQTVISLLVVGLLGLLLSIMISALLVFEIIRPIRTLHIAAQNLRERNWNGALSKAKSVDTNDEIGDLAKAFESMIFDLRAFYTQLETMVQERTNELELINRQLVQINEVKTRFMEDIAHDVRSSLTSILMNISALLRNTQEKERYVKRIEKHVKRIDTLMHHVNSMSSIEFTKTNNRVFEAIDFVSIVQPIVDAHRTTIEELGLNLTVTIPDSAMIYGQRFLLEQLFENLFSNAIKYTHEGQINVTIEQDADQLVLYVQDSGIGIPENDIPLIGRRYYRAENALASTISGTGIGFSIVSEIVKIHRGTFAIQSKVGEGTEVIVTLPVEEQMQATA